MVRNDQDLWLMALLSALPWGRYAVAFLAGYLLGSLPFGYILSRLAGLGDIRTIGSGNIGATNVLRTGKKGLAALTLILDAFKGFLPVFIGHLYFGDDVGLFAGLGAFMGHLFPIWLGFRGGKGVATYIGVLAGLYWPGAAVFCMVWLAVALITRYSSLSALVAATMTPIFLFVETPGLIPNMIAFLSLMLIAKHHKNIRNLISGRESKIGERTT